MMIERINGVPTGQVGRPHREVWILQRLRKAILESLDGQPERGFLFGWVGYRLLNGVKFDPVLSYILNEYAYPVVDDELHFAPELAIELISTSSNFLDLRDKVASYLANGTKLVWVIYPYKCEIAALMLRDKKITHKTYGIKDPLTGGDVLPGFSIAVADIFRSR